MKLTKEDIIYINNVVETAQLVGIDSVIIEPKTTSLLNRLQ